MESTQLVRTVPVDDGLVLRLAVAAYLARYKGLTRVHAETDLRSFFGWTASHDLDPLEAKRAHIELYLRWLQGSGGTSPPPSPDDSRSWPASTGSASSTGSWSTHPPSTSADPTSHQSHPPSG
jgi:hypothetical protein